jgi:hypothetical protein
MFYRFSWGTFVEAGSFDEAKAKMIARVESEEENNEKWLPCTCLGLSHRYNCPERLKGGIPY